MELAQLQQLISDYVPRKGTLDRLEKVRLLAVVGPTAVGKTTLMNYVTALDKNIHLVLSDVSRDPRPGETDGIDYFFHSKNQMLDSLKQGLFAQVRPTFNGEIYASRADSYATSGQSVMAIVADAMPVFRSLPFRKIRTICIIPPSYEVWQTRINLHGFAEAELTKRMQEAYRSFKFAYTDTQSELLLNDDLTKSCDNFLAVVRGGNPKEDQRKLCETLEIIITRLEKELRI
jgi:guanylate kinase